MRSSRKQDSSLVASIKRRERIAGIRETLKLNGYLISYYTDFINSKHPTCSFQIYLRELDKKAKAIKEERKSLIASYDKASNGEIPSLRKQNEELRAKLKKLQIDTSGNEARRMNRKANKIKDLRSRLAALEDQLKDAGFSIEDLMSEMETL